jgi:anti-sigma-K factor RskA
MTDDRSMTDGPHDLAAEYALGVLSGDELRRARELARSDPQFRSEVAHWSGRLAPMLDEVAPVDPPESAWAAIQRRIGPAANNDNVIRLRRRVHQWRGIAAAMSALAACLAIILVVGLPRPGPVAPPTPAPVQQRPAAAPLVANRGDKQEQM